MTPSTLTDRQNRPPLWIGALTKWGEVVAIAGFGERYYWMVDEYGAVAMMPADVIENTDTAADTR